MNGACILNYCPQFNRNVTLAESKKGRIMGRPLSVIDRKIESILPWTVLLLSILICSIYLFVVNSHGYPVLLSMDDSYIHLRLAENLVNTGKAGINPGEGGGGTSSILWTGLLSLLILFRIPAEGGVLVLSIAMWGVSVYLFSSMLFGFCGKTAALVLSLAIALFGNMAAIGLTGMETTLFLALVFASFLFWKSEKPALFYLISSLSVLVRPEALLLQFSILVVLFATRKKRNTALLKRAAIGFTLAFLVMILGAFLAKLLSGVFPQTLVARRWLIDLYLDPVTGIHETLKLNLRFVSLMANRLANLIGPGFGFGLIWALILLSGAGYGTKKAFELKSEIRYLAVYAVLHLLFYALVLPTPAQFGRYLMPFWLILFMLAGYGFDQMKAAPFLAKHNLVRLYKTVIIVLVVGFIPQVFRWMDWYEGSVSHLHKVHKQMALAIDDLVEPGEIIGVMDVGLFSWISNRPIVDLGGLTDPEVLKQLRNEDLPAYLEKNGIRHIILPEYEGPMRDLTAKKLGFEFTSLKEKYRLAVSMGPKPYLSATFVALPSLSLYEIESKSPESRSSLKTE